MTGHSSKERSFRQAYFRRLNEIFESHTKAMGLRIKYASKEDLAQISDLSDEKLLTLIESVIYCLCLMNVRYPSYSEFKHKLSLKSG